MTTSLPLVEIHAVGSCDSVTRQGYYEACIKIGQTRSYFTRALSDTTPNRCVIQGMIDLVARIPQPAKIRLVSITSLGVRKRSGPNHDLASTLKSLLEKNRHKAEFTVISGKSNDVRSFIQSADRGSEAHQESQPSPPDVQPTRPRKPTARKVWFPYVLPPIDFGWESLGTVDEARRVFQAAEAEARGEALKIGVDFEQPDLPYGSQEFDAEWELAVKKDLGMDSDFRDEPAIFWLPGLTKFSYGFVFKADNNGTTYVISPVALPWLDEHSMTNELHKSQGEHRLSGSYKQIQWAEGIIAEALHGYARIAEQMPHLSEAMAGFRELLEAKTSCSWIIANRNNLAFLTHKKAGEMRIRKESIVGHPLLQQRGLRDRAEFRPLMAMAES